MRYPIAITLVKFGVTFARCVTRVPVALCVSPLHSKQRKEELLHVAVLHNTKQGILVSYNNDYITKIVFIVEVHDFLFLTLHFPFAAGLGKILPVRPSPFF